MDTDLRLKVQRAEQDYNDACRKLEEAQRLADAAIRAEKFEKQKKQMALEAKEAVDNSSLPAWLVNWIKYDAYDRGHSAGQYEVDLYISSMIRHIERYRDEFNKNQKAV